MQVIMDVEDISELFNGMEPEVLQIFVNLVT